MRNRASATVSTAHQIDLVVAPAALCRAVLLARAAAAMTAAGAGLLLVEDPLPVLEVLAVVASATAAEVTVLTRWPSVVRSPLLALAIDSLIMIAVLVLSRGTIAYFCYAAGSAALAGVLLGMRALPLWIGQAVLGFVVAAGVLGATRPPPDLAGFVVAFPMAGVMAGIGAAFATAALVRYVSLSVEVIAAAQRSAAASERARLARELHDSLAQTLRGVSFAALALPSSLRRQPALAEQLASTVSQGAEAAAREARQLVTGLRLDSPDRDFDQSVNVLCRRWAEASRVPTRVVAAPIEPAVAVRYELTRILHEALQNVEAHAHARRVDVRLARSGPDVELTVRDDGVGFPMPNDLGGLRSAGHYGIVGMSERAKAVHGSLTVTSAPGAGTVVIVRAPVSGARQPGDATMTEFAT